MNELKSIKSETYSASYMNLVNKQVYKLFEKNMLFPVSLKKSGASVKIVRVNDKNTNIDQIVEYDRVLLDPNNQDVQIFYNLSTYEDNKLLSKKELKAKMKTAKGGFRLELEEASNATARHGSVGVGLQQYIIYNTSYIRLRCGDLCRLYTLIYIYTRNFYTRYILYILYILGPLSASFDFHSLY